VVILLVAIMEGAFATIGKPGRYGRRADPV
jgi:hypothetical protein